tara:strand:- start:3287 stop:3796 length:510 start_codon:yes stop_codon:yes gene_type:complete
MNINDINEMSDDMFIDCFKNIFERTPLIANLSLSKKPFKDKKHLIDVFMNEFEKLDHQTMKKIIRNHPDLGNKIRINNNLTDLSKNEQKNAGLNNCTPAEYSFFHKMNNEFKSKFDIPFIFAVKGSNKNIIIEEFKKRLSNNDIDNEFKESVKQVKKIANFRLEEIIGE